MAKTIEPIGRQKEQQRKAIEQHVTKIENEENETCRTNSTTKMTVIYDCDVCL